MFGIIVQQSYVPAGHTPSRRVYPDDGYVLCPTCEGRKVVPSRNPDRDIACPSCVDGQIEEQDKDEQALDDALQSMNRMMDAFFKVLP